MSKLYQYTFECICSETKMNNEDRFEIIKECVEAGVNINYNNSQILKRAIGDGDMKLFHYLFDNGIDIHVDDDEPLRIACSYNQIEIVKLLISVGANTNDVFTKAPLFDLDIIKLLVEHGANPFDRLNRMFINLCHWDEYFPIIQYFISIGADCTLPDNKPIITSFSNNHVLKIKRLLLENSADPNAVKIKGDKKVNLLELAVQKRDFNGFKLLLEYGANLNLCQNIINKTNIIRYENIMGFVDLFKENGLDIELIYK